MRYIGLDLGTKTLGISISDRNGQIANAYKTLNFKEGDLKSILPNLKDIVRENKVSKIILGLPKNMDNSIGEKGEYTLTFKKMLESFLNIDIILEDERWTTLQADKLLIQADMSRKKRKKVIDKLAATVILQSYLDKKNRKEC